MGPDFSTVALSPTNLASERVWSVFWDVLVAGGWDPRYGARLCGDLPAVGLVNVESDNVASCCAGGSLACRLLSMTFGRLRERIALGADSQEIDEARPCSRILRTRSALRRPAWRARRGGPSSDPPVASYPDARSCPPDEPASTPLIQFSIPAAISSHPSATIIRCGRPANSR